MTLYINTRDQSKITVSLKDRNKVIASLTEENQYGSQVLLPLINKLLQSKDVSYKDLKKIEVETSKGSFTGLKVGVSVANAIGFALDISVNNKKLEIDLKY